MQKKKFKAFGDIERGDWLQVKTKLYFTIFSKKVHLFYPHCYNGILSKNVLFTIICEREEPKNIFVERDGLQLKAGARLFCGMNSLIKYGANYCLLSAI